MTLGRCPLSIFCSRGTPSSLTPREPIRTRYQAGPPNPQPSKNTHTQDPNPQTLYRLWPRFRTRQTPEAGPRRGARYPTPYTIHPTPYTLHPTPYTLHPSRRRGERRAARPQPKREARGSRPPACQVDFWLSMSCVLCF